jgi:ATP-dependent Clp protease, protease subunit
VIEPTYNAFYIPNVTEQTARGAETRSVFDRLLKDRIIFLGTAIDDGVANSVIAQLLFLQMDDGKKDINIYINSPGGSFTALTAIYDTMQFVRPDVVTYCIGQSASIAAVLLASGTPKKRYALPNSRVLIHQPWMSGLSGQATDIDIHAKEIIRTRASLNHLLAGHTGQPVEKIERDVERDFIMTAEQAKAYGVVDEIITKHR